MTRMQPEMDRQLFERGEWAKQPMAMRPETLPGTLKAYTGVDGTARKKDPIITHLTHLTEKEKRKVER